MVAGLHLEKAALHEQKYRDPLAAESGFCSREKRDDHRTRGLFAGHCAELAPGNINAELCRKSRSRSPGDDGKGWPPAGREEASRARGVYRPGIIAASPDGFGRLRFPLQFASLRL